MISFLNLTVKEKISILLLLLINFLFSLKYFSRYSEYSLFISILLSYFYLVLLSNSIQLKVNNKTLKRFIYVLIIVFISISIFIFYKVDVSTLNVDRWSVISSFWNSLFNGEYPYYAYSHMNNHPGPMPVYFLLALPFYLVNELGYFSLLGFILFLYLINKINTSANYKLLLTIFLMTSTFYGWELISRSNIFTNSFLILWFLMVFIERKNKNDYYLYFNAVIAGLLISTRAIFIIPFIVFFIFSLRKKYISIPKIFIFVLISAITFLLTLLPFILFYPEDFFKMNPFIIQSSFFIPSYYIIIFMLIAFLLSFFVKNKNELFFYAGLSLFLAILIYFIYHIISSGFNTAYFKSKVDISYFIFCIPFFIIYLVKMDHFKNSPEFIR